MNALQARLLAGRAVRAAQEQETFARLLRPAPEVPAQRARDGESAPLLKVVHSPSA
ncbi:hypothetical protein [Nocardioides pakistanensis]